MVSKYEEAFCSLVLQQQSALDEQMHDFFGVDD
jgi:hypothetical protein